MKKTKTKDLQLEVTLRITTYKKITVQFEDEDKQKHNNSHFELLRKINDKICIDSKQDDIEKCCNIKNVYWKKTDPIESPDFKL